MNLRDFVAVCVGFLMVQIGQAALKSGDCEVCISVLDKFKATLDKKELSKPDKIEAKFKEYCSELKLKENRFVIDHIYI